MRDYIGDGIYNQFEQQYKNKSNRTIKSLEFLYESFSNSFKNVSVTKEDFIDSIKDLYKKNDKESFINSYQEKMYELFGANKPIHYSNGDILVGKRLYKKNELLKMEE